MYPALRIFFKFVIRQNYV